MFKKNKEKFKIEDFSTVCQGLNQLYIRKLLPLETAYKFHELERPRAEIADFTGPPMVMFVGQYSTGKTTFIRYLLNQDYPECRIGPEPTTDRFIAIMHGDNTRSIPGNAVVVDPSKPFRVLSKFGNNFLNRFTCVEINHELTKGLTIIDTPGILSGTKQTDMRGYDFTKVFQSFSDRCDRIYLIFDAHKLDISDEFRQTIDLLSGQDSKIRIVLNKADRVDQQSLMRVYGALMWSLGKIIKTPEVARVYIGSFWDEPYLYDENKKLFELEEVDLMKDLCQLPCSSILRKLNDFLSRCRSAITNAHIVAEIAKSMPSVLFKEKKKIAILESLPELFKRLAISLAIPMGDFPKVDEYREKLKHLDFSKFPLLKPKLLEEVNKMMTEDIPKLMQRIPLEESSQPDKSMLKGGIFAKLVPSTTEEDSYAINPFDQDADAKLMMGGNEQEWVVKRFKSQYDEIFESLNPIDGKLSGTTVREYLNSTKLTRRILFAIWRLSDIDEDGELDSDEFALCKYLVDMQLNNINVPSELTPQLIPPSKRK
ncbi:hypothetical protein HZS_3954 [Henneguya salminicola]|nr:hypothetical protein HZS_3954 [Henneguya salminicola]